MLDRFSFKKNQPAQQLVLGVFILALFLPWASGSQEPVESSEQLKIQALFTPSPPKIDGKLDDPVWEMAVPFDRFLQREPVEGGPPSESTVIRILRDDENLYLSFRCFDSEPDKIIANRMRRDFELDENDNVLIILDTYDDRRGGFFFSTNPLGATWDVLLTNEGRSRNEAWNCVWSCNAARDALGWTAEMAIPFDQLRYAESADATWGINIGRAIRRKNEEVFLVPPPQSYGFDGRFRTSRLATLHGLGALRPRPRLELIPYLQSGSTRDFEAPDSGTQNTLDTGVDLKYGLTPSLTLDLSYRTDFAQVEADQEQVNLTRFSLFFPEKRGFFLEGAGIFEFGERVSRSGSGRRPPTLLFYSRRIGLQEGHSLPVVFGSKLTGRVGPYEMGVINITTEKKTFLDIEQEERFLTDAGAMLDEEDPQLQDATILDTVEVDVVDTVRAALTNFSVLRLRRDVLDRSSVGLIVLNRDPGEEAGYNRSFGVDANLSLFETAFNLRGFAARTWSPDLRDKDLASHLALEYRMGLLETGVSYLDVQENFNPEVGFVPRQDIRRFQGRARYRPRPSTAWIRRYSLGPELTYLMDQDNVLQTRELRTSFFVNLELGDWIGVRHKQRFERLDEPFDIHEGIEIPVGDYTFSTYSFSFFTSERRRISGRSTVEFGNFFNGTRRRFSCRGSFKLNHRLTLGTDYELNRIELLQDDFTTNSLSNRFLYSFTPDFFVRGLVQWNSKSEVVGGNFMLNYRYHPGSDLFLVYNQVWDTEGHFVQLNRSLQLKFTYFWKR